MPPRRKRTSSTKEIQSIIISTEDIGKADDYVSNQDDPHGFAAAVKRRGRKVAISAKEKGESADSVDLPKTKISIRSSKQKALHKILSMDKEDADDCVSSARAWPNIGDTENACSEATVDPKHTNKKKQGPRAKKAKEALETIPDEAATEANFVELGAKIVSGESKQVSELYANGEKPGRGKRRGARANENDQCKRRTHQEEEQQGNGSQWKMINGHKASGKRRDSSMLEPGHSMTLSPNQAPGNLSKKTVDCLSMPIEKLDSLTQAPTKPEAKKKDQTLNVRSSIRTKKVVHYNEQSPESDSNEKRVFVTTELKAQTASKRNASAAKFLPRGVKRVKEDPTSASEGPMGLDSARAPSVKRGRRRQELSSPQNLANNSSAASRQMGNGEEFREHQKERKSQQINSASAFNNMDSDKGFLLQTAQPESVKFSTAEEGAKLVSATGKRESCRIAYNQDSRNRSLSDKAQDQMMADEPTAGISVVQPSIQDLQLISDRKKSNACKGRKIDSKRRALPDTAQKPEGDLLEALPLESDEEAKPKVLEAATRRDDSSAKLLPRGANMVKEEPTSAQEETIELDSARVTCMRRGRRNYKLSSLQNPVDKKSVAFINHRGTEDNEELRNSGQTGQPESVKFSPPQECAKLVSATGLEKTSNTGSMMHGKRESDHIAHNQTCQKNSLPENSQDQMMADKSTCLEVLSKAAGKSDSKKLITSKGRKVNSRQRAVPDTAQNAEGDLLEALPLGPDKEAKPKVLEAPLFQGAANSMTDARPEEMCGTYESADAERKLYYESHNRGRNTSMRKRTLQGTAQEAKKQKISVLDTLSSPASLDILVEGAVPARNQEHEKAIQEMEPEDWNAVDIIKSQSRVERSSEKKRREEIKRKRAMKFDALPVGFGLGISCWSTPPWAEQSIEEEVVGEVDLSVMRFQVQSISLSPMKEAQKQQCLQETAMSKDAVNITTSLGLEDTYQEMGSSVMGLQVQLKSPMEEAKKRLCLREIAMLNDAMNTSPGVKDSYHAPRRSATALQGSSFSMSDAERLTGSGLKPVPKNDSIQQQEKAKVKRQVARKTKASRAVLSELPQAVYTGSDNSVMNKENVEPTLHAHNESELKMSRNSRRRIATAGMEKTTRTRRN